MHYLYDMGYYINHSLHRIIRQNEEVGYTPLSYEFAKDVAKDVRDALCWEIEKHPDPANQFHLCFDDKDNQIRPEYKQRQTCPMHHVVKYLTQELLLYDWLDCPAHRHVGNGFNARDWIFNFRKANSKKGVHTQFHTDTCDLLCNIDDFTTGVFHKPTDEFYINNRNWNFMIENVFRYKLPFNTMWLYETTVGNPSDHIAGIRRFGEKAFDKMIKTMEQDGVNFSNLSAVSVFEEFLSSEDGLQKYLTEDQLKQAIESWQSVCPTITGHAPVKSVENKKEEIER